MFNPNRVRSSINARADLPPVPALTPSQLFPAVLAATFSAVKVDSTTEAGYIRVQLCRPENETKKALLTEFCQHLAKLYGWSFDGYDEDGYPCFIL